MLKSSVCDKNFLYFSYGANMYKFRIHMHCPTAEFVSIARVDVSCISMGFPTSQNYFILKLLFFV